MHVLLLESFEVEKSYVMVILKINKMAKNNQEAGPDI